MNNKIRKSYYVYILSSNTGTLYTGVTNHLLRRMDEHKGGKLEGFTKRYKVNRLIYFEETTDIQGNKIFQYVDLSIPNGY